MYLALYRKWRPKNFDDVISQPHITTTLKQEINTGHIAHAYLFTGSRGTGKTTCAKIFAKAVNCLNPKNGEPCGECDICRGLEDGSILDVDEMDGASNNRVDDIRVLREEAAFTPVSCKYRVYIIDEVHMLTTSAFNALLKIMEEPPAHIIFILATTEVHKVPATIVSRCQRFDFHRIKTKDIQKRLLQITEYEDFSITPDAAFLIAKCADGAMRDALSVLDRVAVRFDDITEEAVAESLGISGQSDLFRIHRAIEQNDTVSALNTLRELYESSKDLGRLLEELILFYRNILVEKSAPGSEGFIIASKDDYLQIQQIAKDCSYDFILKTLDDLQQCSKDFSSASNKKLELEICFIKLTTKQTDFSVRLPSGKSSDKSVGESDLSAEVEKEATPEPIEKASPKKPKESGLTDKSSVSEKEDTTALSKIEPLLSWPDILEALKEKDNTGMLSGFLSGSSAFTRGDNLYIRSPNPIVTERIAKKKQLLEDVIEQHTGHKYRLLLKGGAQAAENLKPIDKMVERAKQEGIPVERE